jgi:imidazolonepropionase-like amidohydrolase
MDTVVFRQLRLFDGKSSSLRDNVQVIVQGAKIAATDAANNPPPADATVIDCGGRVVMPGCRPERSDGPDASYAARA